MADYEEGMVLTDSSGFPHEGDVPHKEGNAATDTTFYYLDGIHEGNVPYKEGHVVQSHIHNINEVHTQQQSRGDRVADNVTQTMGTWKFIAIQGVILFAWMIGNVVAFLFHFDPYPFIFLNLLLGIFSTFAAPFILMSQNRQAAKDSLVLDHNYELAKRDDVRLDAFHIEQQEQAAELAGIFSRLDHLDLTLDKIDTLIRENLHQHPLRQRNIAPKKEKEEVTLESPPATPVPVYIPLPSYAPNPYNPYANPFVITGGTTNVTGTVSFIGENASELEEEGD